jgi:hypothetical protein
MTACTLPPRALAARRKVGEDLAVVVPHGDVDDEPPGAPRR